MQIESTDSKKQLQQMLRANADAIINKLKEQANTGKTEAIRLCKEYGIDFKNQSGN
jgi:hypothetical protein